MGTEIPKAPSKFAAGICDTNAGHNFCSGSVLPASRNEIAVLPPSRTFRGELPEKDGEVSELSPAPQLVNDDLNGGLSGEVGECG